MSRLIDRLAEGQCIGASWDAPMDHSAVDELMRMPRNQLEKIKPQIRELREAISAELHEKTDGILNELVKQMKGAVAVVADNVALWFFENYDWEHLEISDCPNGALPFDKVWIETRRGLGAKSPCVIGAFLESFDAFKLRVMTALEPLRDQLIRHQDARWIIKATLVVEEAGTVFMPLCAAYSVDGDGRIMGQPSEMGMDGNPSHLVSTDKDASNYRGIWLALLITSVAFMHCKNVQRVENAPPPKVNKARIKRGKPPLVKFYTLQIDGMKQVLMSQGGDGASGIKHALHICRGHFKTYTAERPLFGRVVGTVWCSQHLRGKAEHGVVVKDYAVSPPPKNEPEASI